MSNPLVHKNRRLSQSPSAWVRSFACEDLRPLIVCRGPIRKEALDTFKEMGMTHVGMLLSEKDSIVYTNALAPELREHDPKRVHRVQDYSGATKEERVKRTQEIIAIAKANNYDSVFAGYGFMAEDEDFVRAIEEGGLTFIGPCSGTQRAAGRKDEAKRTAIRENVTVTPGVSNAAARAILRKFPDRNALLGVIKDHGLTVANASEELDQLAEQVLTASYRKAIDLYSIDELASELEDATAKILIEHPNRRVRLKWVGGGGGKGQRIVTTAAVVPEKVREILLEVKAVGRGDNKNILLELNVEETRHHEIQLVGNGEWCIALGGRDCSLQMHEQKLLEVSITSEALETAIERARGDANLVAALEEDKRTLEKMEAEAERFGRAVGLDSASTFECIVEGGRHYFMEVNTRIQVEHRVTELCYGLRFENPDDHSDAFVIDSLVEAMAVIARHAKQLPHPKRSRRENAAVEARLNATDSSLSPHAGGVITSWTEPLPFEIRDDQGISSRNPDTRQFIRYRFAGAYDSNVALIVTVGTDRKDSFNKLQEVLRVTKLRGEDLSTNLEFHYGLLSWFTARNVWAKPTTRFVVPYLTQVGLLKKEANDLDLDLAFKERAKRAKTPAQAEMLARKETLLLRPMRWLLADPHVFSAWLSGNMSRWEISNGKVKFTDNPAAILRDTYRTLNMDHAEGWPAAHVIWDHDRVLLQKALGFYARLDERLGSLPWTETEAILANAETPESFTPELWAKARAAHAGYSAGMELLGLLPLLADRAQFFDLKVEPDLRIRIPERLLDPKLQAEMKKVLVPPPETQSDEIVAAMGGMCYLREAPGLPPIVEEGGHFKAGQPIYIIEVMKMFNKVVASFSGTVKKVHVTDGIVVRKGQRLFEVEPDEPLVVEDESVKVNRRKEATKALLAGI